MSTLPEPPIEHIAGALPAVPVPPPVPLPLSTPASSRSPAAAAPVFVWACPSCQTALQSLTTTRRGACPACGAMIEAPEPPAAATPPATTPAHKLKARLEIWWRRRSGRATALGILLAALCVGAVGLVRSPAWNRLLQPEITGMPPLPASLQQLQEKLRRFLRAPAWEAKRAYVLDAERLEPRAAEYYRGRDPDEINADDFQPWAIPSLARLTGVIVLRADRPGRRPVLAIFREVDGEWYLDWEMFCQTYDEALPAYLATPAFPLRTFRTRVNRAFPNAPVGGTYAVQLSDPLDPGQRVTVELPTGTPIMQSIASGLNGAAARDATVEVSWARPDPEGAWVPILHRLVCWEWHGLNGVPEASAPASPTHDRFILPTAAPLNSAPPTTEKSVAATAP